jgi:exopolyphosphatase/pppGpp-phosphohydrolase
MRIAIIDLGTNTFNLLIAQLPPSGSYDIAFLNTTLLMLLILC